jgi:transposase
MAKKYRVTLTTDERQELDRLISRGKGDARQLAHARILLQADETRGRPARDDVSIASALDVSVRTVERVRQRFVEEGFELALKPRPTKRVYQRLLDGRQEARLIKLACSTPPDGKGRWTLRLLADQMVALNHVETLSHETVRRTLKKTNSSRT